MTALFFYKGRRHSAFTRGLAASLCITLTALPATPALAAPGDIVTNGTSTGITAPGFLFEPEVPFTSLKNVPTWIEKQADVWSVLEEGKDPDDYPRGGFRGYFAQASEIAPLHEGLGFETLVVAGVEPAISADDESYNRLQGRERQQWLDVLYAMSAEPSIVGASRHLLYIGKKK